jgi:hypothetical protein
MSPLRPFRRLLAAVVLVGVLGLATPAAAARVVAVGDVHGSYEGLVGILVEAGLVDAEQRWVGGDATLVQTGDLLDRGVRVRRVLDLLIRLQGEAAAAGGRVVVLVGNHEGMNLLGILRDVNSTVYETFVDGRSERRRAAAFREYKAFWTRQTRGTGEGRPSFDAIEEQWLAARPLGWVEYLAALAADGEYGRWLRSCPAAALVDGTLFMHGGPGDATLGHDVAQLNRTVAAELDSFDRTRAWAVEAGVALPLSSIYDLERAVGLAQEAGRVDLELRAAVSGWQQWFLVDPEGPLWFRGAALWEDERASELLARLDALGAERLVVGHTPQRSKRIAQRFAGRVFLIDTGMLVETYDGRASALVFEDGAVTAVYPGGEREVLVAAVAPPTLAAGQ